MIKLPVVFDNFSPRKDRSFRVSFETQELPDEYATIFRKSQDKFGWLVFSENEVDTSDIPTEDAEDKNKTPSKRLRAALYVYWKQLGSNGDFEVYYREKMEKLIDSVKAKLD